MNQLIRYVDSLGLGKSVYDCAFPAMILVSLLFLLFYRRNYQLSIKQTVLVFACFIPLSLMMSVVLAWIASGFTIFGPSNYLRTYVFNPFICLLIAKLLKIRRGVVLDLIAAMLPIMHAVGHLGCPFTGCCHGYPSSWGFWNPVYNKILFPIQWLESLVALAITMWLMWQAKKENYTGSGKLHAMMLVAFGYTRFLLEFLRDNDKLILGISNLAFHALFIGVVGTIWLFVFVELENENKRKAEIYRRKRCK